MSGNLGLNVIVISGVAVAGGLFLNQKTLKQDPGVAPRVTAASAVQSAPALPQASGIGRVEIKSDPMGHFSTSLEINGRRISALVDTGATFLSLTTADAKILGVMPRPSEFTTPVQTATGVTKGAQIKLSEVRLDTLRVFNVDALVLPGDVAGTSLLGMSFLKKLGGVEVAAGRLTLRP